MNDPIADMLTRIKNGMGASKPYVVLPASKTNFAICKIIERLGWIKDAEKVKKSGDLLEIRVGLVYDGSGKSKWENVRRISKPGRRIYVESDYLKRFLSGTRIAIVSTSRGMMTAREASKLGIGGELICEIW